MVLLLLLLLLRGNRGGGDFLFFFGFSWERRGLRCIGVEDSGMVDRVVVSDVIS